MSDEDRKNSARRTGEGLRAVAVLGGAGFTLAASVALGAMGGRWLDVRLDTEPWFTVLGFLLGTAAGFMQMMRMVSAAGKHTDAR